MHAYTKVGGCRCPRQGHVSSGARSENNEDLGAAVLLRCRDIASRVPSLCRVMPFVRAIIRVVIVVVIVICSAEAHGRHLVVNAHAVGIN